MRETSYYILEIKPATIWNSKLCEGKPPASRVLATRERAEPPAFSLIRKRVPPAAADSGAGGHCRSSTPPSAFRKGSVPYRIRGPPNEGEGGSGQERQPEGMGCCGFQTMPQRPTGRAAKTGTAANCLGPLLRVFLLLLLLPCRRTPAKTGAATGRARVAPPPPEKTGRRRYRHPRAAPSFRPAS
jgi:hypothetical protein